MSATLTTTLTTQEVADKLVELCRTDQAEAAIRTLYSSDIVSIEAVPMQDGSRETKGLEAVMGKSQWWVSAHEVHSAKVEGPLVAGPYFSVRFTYDVTQRASGKRITMDELGMYHVTDGKIDREEFFYGK